jgi:hypothetical protein
MKRRTPGIDCDVFIEFANRLVQTSALQIARRQQRMNLQLCLGVVCRLQPRSQFAVSVPDLAVPAFERRRHCRQLSGELRSFVAIETRRRSVERDHGGEERIPLGRGWCGKENNAKCTMHNAKPQAL